VVSGDLAKRSLDFEQDLWPNMSGGVASDMAATERLRWLRFSVRVLRRAVGRGPVVKRRIGDRRAHADVYAVDDEDVVLPLSGHYPALLKC
jgi:hypothetical protein